MSSYIVEMVGNVREVYLVEADNAQKARESWMDGELVNSEASSMEFYSVRLDEE